MGDKNLEPANREVTGSRSFSLGAGSTATNDSGRVRGGGGRGRGRGRARGRSRGTGRARSEDSQSRDDSTKASPNASDSSNRGGGRKHGNNRGSSRGDRGRRNQRAGTEKRRDLKTTEEEAAIKPCSQIKEYPISPIPCDRDVAEETLPSTNGNSEVILRHNQIVLLDLNENNPQDDGLPMHSAKQLSGNLESSVKSNINRDRAETTRGPRRLPSKTSRVHGRGGRRGKNGKLAEADSGGHASTETHHDSILSDVHDESNNRSVHSERIEADEVDAVGTISCSVDTQEAIEASNEIRSHSNDRESNLCSDVAVVLPETELIDFVVTPAVDEVQTEKFASDIEKDATKEQTELLLPQIPSIFKTTSSNPKSGVVTILSRQSKFPPVIRAAQNKASHHIEANKEDVNDTITAQESKIITKQHLPPKAPKTKKLKKTKTTKDSTEVVGESDMIGESEQPVNLSIVEALEKLPPQEVSITAETQVKILRSTSSISVENDSEAPPKSVGPSLKLKSSKKKTKALSGDEKINQKAARRFNNEVRMCVEQSDPDTMREILHDRRNHKFALDSLVLETVMKAYVMAAMLDDALYCLRVCTIPGTLSLIQTERILQCLPQNLRSSNAYTAADMINALCIATIFDSAAVRTYFLRIVRGIALEFLEEATSARDRICSASCERLVRSAVCIVDARLKRGKKPTELIVINGDQLGVFISDTMENRGIQAGDAVSILPYAGPYPMSAESLDRNMIEATVVNTNPTVVRLQDKANAALHAMLTEDIEGNVYRIDKLANRMGFNRQLSAAVAFCNPVEDNPNGTRDTRRPCPQLIKAITVMDENINKMTGSGVATYSVKGSLSSTAALCAEAIPWNVDDERENFDQDSIRAAARFALEKYGAFENLNASQQLAVEGATTHRLTLVQGPPGTGKTMTALRILQHWARLAEAEKKPGSEASPVLATSDSNIAVDNLVEGCAAVGLRVVRLGRPEAIRPELLRFCIDRPQPAYGNNNSDTPTQSYSAGFGGTSHKERMKQLKNAQVVCCTCIGSGSDILDSLGPLERVLVDEATQATEPAVLVPLMRGCRQLVLVGDHAQLPPTVLSTRAEEEGHGVPLFSRMVACGVPPFMLDTQYRMHPCIAMFPSDLFYGGLLKNGVSAPERRPLAGFPWPREEFPVAFIPVKGVEMDDGVSKYNEEEADIACKAVISLLEGGQCTVSDIAVVTPYAAQARLIRRMSRRLINVAGPPFLEVSSVDGFQGREKEAVVFSAVRSNDYGALGFTSDWRRINVSFTRARRALIVIGNDQTLKRGDPETWHPWFAWVEAHGLNVEHAGVPRGRYDPEQLRRVRGGITAAEMLKDVLERQQAQLKSAAKEQERAMKNAVGHITGGGEEDDIKALEGETQGMSLEENLQLAQNAEGNWDDSDDDEKTGTGVSRLSHSVSRTTIASGSSVDYRSNEPSENIADAWDL